MSVVLVVGVAVWDVVVVLVAIASPVIALATLVLVPLSSKGRRKTSIAVVALQIAAILHRCGAGGGTASGSSALVTTRRERARHA